MDRFFLHPDQIIEGTVTFPEALSKQIRKVLRLDTKKDAVVVLDNSGREYLVQLDGVTGNLVTGHVMDWQAGRPEPMIQLSVAYSLAKREKIEWIIQKGTEIGIARFIPYISSRSFVQDLNTNRARQDRLEAIAREAAEQSQRSRLPILLPVSSYGEMLKNTASYDLKLIAWEGTAIVQRVCLQTLQPLVGKKEQSLVLLIGPEGGFSAEEVSQAESFGFEQISLGNTILRMETACLAGGAILRHLIDMLLM
ncbi:MAG: 16S rRNA (uracil(1498)-N(3))-methyltransferase [Chloroflexi bacterium]|nr:16S rRNA (uracil(1498)-N(3))-methyltransferase [Chloroflexota bacterium]